jgi:aspartate kinase
MQPAGSDSGGFFFFREWRAMRVLKFGGTSVADAGAIARVVSIVAARGGARTVVVSALAGATDALLAIADAATRDLPAAQAALDSLTARHRSVAATLGSDYARRVVDPALEGIARGASGAIRAIASDGATAALVDRLVACGELWSSRLVSAALVEAGLPAQWIDARHVLRTDGCHGEAAPDFEATNKAVTRLVRPALALERIVVVGGFIGSGPDGATTTLGRGGSDYSAAIFGACLLADEIEIWTDVDGVLTADPRVVPGARVLPALSYEDAATLATFGAKVLHPRTIEPAASREIPVRVLNSLRPSAPGTLIDALGDASAYAAVASRGGLCLLELTARDRFGAAGFSVRALQGLAEANVHVVLGEVHGDRVHVAVDRRFDLDAVKSRIGSFAHVRSRDGLSAVCAVGEQVANDPRGVAGALALFHEPIHLVARPGGASAFAVVVDDRHAHSLVERLHALFVSHTEVVREGVA